MAEAPQVQRLRIGIEVVGVLLTDEYAGIHAEVGQRVVQRGVALFGQVFRRE